jgi:hypothetical protein
LHQIQIFPFLFGGFGKVSYFCNDFYYKPLWATNQKRGQMKKLTFMVTMGLLTLALVTTGCGTKNAPGAEGETADSTAVEAEAVDESAYDLEAIAKAIEGC